MVLVNRLYDLFIAILYKKCRFSLDVSLVMINFVSKILLFLPCVSTS